MRTGFTAAGINANNVIFVMNHVDSLHQLSTLSLERLTTLIGAANAKQVWIFISSDGKGWGEKQGGREGRGGRVRWKGVVIS